MMTPAITARRSKNRTSVSIHLDWSEFSIVHGWNTVYDYGKRIAAMAAFLVVCASLVPLWSPGQSALDYRLQQHESQLQELKGVPSQIAVINQKLDEQSEKTKEIGDSVDKISAFAFTAAVGVLVFLLSWLFKAFGGQALKNRRDQP